MQDSKSTDLVAQTSVAARKPYPSDVSDEEWAFVQPYLALVSEKSPQRHYPLREVFNALRWMIRSGSPWRYLPTNFPPWQAVYQQTQRWIQAGVFEDIVDDLREMLRVAQGRNAQPSAMILDGQTLPGTIESGPRAGYDGHKKKKGCKVHVAVDTLGLLLAVVVTPANEQERAQVEELCHQVQELTRGNITHAWADQGYTGDEAEQVAQEQGIKLEIVRLGESKKGFVLLPRRWVVERSFAWKSRFRRLVRDYERLPETVAGLHFAVFAIIMLTRLFATAKWGP